MRGVGSLTINTNLPVDLSSRLAYNNIEGFAKALHSEYIKLDFNNIKLSISSIVEAGQNSESNIIENNSTNTITDANNKGAFNNSILNSIIDIGSDDEDNELDAEVIDNLSEYTVSQSDFCICLDNLGDYQISSAMRNAEYIRIEGISEYQLSAISKVAEYICIDDISEYQIAIKKITDVTKDCICIDLSAYQVSCYKEDEIKGTEDLTDNEDDDDEEYTEGYSSEEDEEDFSDNDEEDYSDDEDFSDNDEDEEYPLEDDDNEEDYSPEDDDEEDYSDDDEEYPPEDDDDEEDFSDDENEDDTYSPEDDADDEDFFEDDDNEDEYAVYSPGNNGNEDNNDSVSNITQSSISTSVAPAPVITQVAINDTEDIELEFSDISQGIEEQPKNEIKQASNSQTDTAPSKPKDADIREVRAFVKERGSITPSELQKYFTKKSINKAEMSGKISKRNGKYKA